MNGQIKAAMQKACPDLKADNKLALALRRFRLSFMTKNAEHATFFGGNLTGVQVVRFTAKDRDEFFVDVCGVDEYDLEEKLAECPAINKDWIVSSDTLNNLCMWIIHLYLNSTTVTPNTRQAAILDAGLILHYRFLTSMLYRFFPYPVDLDLAQSVYAAMSNKFSIKQFGSWQKVLENRCSKLVEKESIHYNTLLNYVNDAKIIYLMNDTQGRIKDTVKNIVGLFNEVRKSNSRVRTSSLVLEQDGDSILLDKTKGLQKYTTYMHSIASDEASFVKNDIVDIISKVVPTAPSQLLVKVLQWCSKNYNYSNKDIVKTVIDKTLLHSFAYLDDNRNVYKRSTDLPKLISKLKGVYSSSRSTDPTLLQLRDYAESLVKSTGYTKNTALIASLRNALLLYIVIRAFTMAHYSKLS